MARAGFFSDFSTQAAGMGAIVALVGYASSVAVVVAGLKAVGASTLEITSALVLLGLGKGLIAIGLSLWTRLPVSIAWTTPGLALLATTGVVEGGFPAAVGAFLVVGVMIAITGLFKPLGDLVASIPKPIANAMLAGIILKLALAPFLALAKVPVTALLVLITWAVVQRFYRLWAVPAAVVVALCAIAVTGLSAEGAGPALAWPSVTWITPVWTWQAMVSIALPVYIVTMASQNITGLAVMGSFGYRPPVAPGLVATGAYSALTAPLGAPTLNFAAITAALCCGPDAHADPARRYVAAVVAGVGYMAFAGLAGVTAAIVTQSPPVLIEAVAGLALIGALGGALKAAVDGEATRTAALVTFLLTASGLSVMGVGAAFWGLIGGLAVMGLDRLGKPPVRRG
jgi:benzoate membrane transport protein